MDCDGSLRNEFVKKIKLVKSDIDGVLGKFVKPDYPNKQDIEPHKEYMDKIKLVIEQHAKNGIMHSVCTGRARYSVETIVNYIGINAPSVFEHGTEIWIPGKDSYRLVEKEHPNLVKPSDYLESWIREVGEYNISRYFPNAEFIRRRKENSHILTYEFLGVTGNGLYKKLEQLMPTEVKSNIDMGALRVVISESEIDGKQTGAIDIMPNISKADGVKHAIKMLGLKKEEVLGIEDSYHSGIPLMQETGHVACPANAQDELKSYVSKRGGFIASKSYAEGWLEIMRRLFADSLESI